MGYGLLVQQELYIWTYVLFLVYRLIHYIMLSKYNYVL